MDLRQTGRCVFRGGVGGRLCGGGTLLGGFLGETEFTQARHAVVALALRLFLLLDGLVVLLAGGGKVLLGSGLAGFPHRGVPLVRCDRKKGDRLLRWCRGTATAPKLSLGGGVVAGQSTTERFSAEDLPFCPG